ncbi:MAG: hypothetical protein AAFU61_18000, partial [Pseudomonadota bacterium]
ADDDQPTPSPPALSFSYSSAALHCSDDCAALADHYYSHAHGGGGGGVGDSAAACVALAAEDFACMWDCDAATLAAAKLVCGCGGDLFAPLDWTALLDLALAGGACEAWAAGDGGSPADDDEAEECAAALWQLVAAARPVGMDAIVSHAYVDGGEAADKQRSGDAEHWVEDYIRYHLCGAAH